MRKLKKNVDEFNRDVIANEGYRYTTHAPSSSILANKRLTEITIDLIDRKSKSIVDIGCGDGIYTYGLKKKFRKMDFWGFDPAQVAIRKAKKLYPSIKFLVANILEKKSLPKKHFDLAIIRGVLHHLTDQQLALKNCAYVADQVLIIEPNGNNPLLKIIEKISPYHRLHEERSFSEKQFRTWCSRANLEIKRLLYVGFVPFFFPAPLAKIIYVFQPLLEKIPLVNKYLGAQIIILCSVKSKRKKT